MIHYFYNGSRFTTKGRIFLHSGKVLTCYRLQAVMEHGNAVGSKWLENF